MKISLINEKETSAFGVPIKYFQIGEEVITFSGKISEGDNVKLSGSRLVSSSNNEQCWLINLVGDSIFLTSGEILLKGVYNNSKVDALLKVPVNEWALTYNAYDDEYTLYRFTPDKVEWERGVNADVAMSFYGLTEFPIEVVLEEEGDE